jgi:hypothetical protein
VRVQYVGPRSYVPAGSHPGRVVTIPGLSRYGGAPLANPAGGSYLSAVMFSVVVSVTTQLLLRWFERRK